MSEFENEYTWGKAVSDNSTDKFHADFEKAIDEVKKELGKKYPIIINGKEIYSDNCFTASSPSDTRISVAEFPKATVDDTKMLYLVQKMHLKNGVTFHFKNALKYLEIVQILFLVENSFWQP